MNIRTFLADRVRSAMSDVGIPNDYSPHLAASKKAGFGDYQANGAMAAAKAMKTNPRELAQSIANSLDLSGVASKVEIAGPGFINIHLDKQWLSNKLATSCESPQLDVSQKPQQQTVVIDYSSPNLAKEMHVGHLRSTIIGDAVARVLEFTGDKVIRQNHVGDWGTQFGMLIAELETQLTHGEQAELALKDLEGFYQKAKAHFDEDAAFANRARDYVVKLQSGDANVLKLWQQFKNVSLLHSEEIYKKLNVTLTAESVYGESAYNDDLAPVVADLREKSLVVEDEGAQVAFLQELADKNGEPSPVIVQKKDGGFLYATTDLAALRYRANSLNADRVLYFIDARQSLHMQQVFTLARKAEFVSEWMSLEHHPFGTMMGADGKPFKTRSGGTVKLADLLEEAVERAAVVVSQKNPDLTAEEMTEVARKVGIGAVKYADLSKTRTNDYIFNWDTMLSFEGNTGPYLQYAYTRIKSIFRKANLEMDSFNAELLIKMDQEKALALKTLQFSEVIEQVAEEAFPHILCTYLYDLASLFMTFYEACPILKPDVEPDTRESRLMLSKATALTLQTGLDLLGIEVMERM
ncbi:arginine--tRNA ligase [Teredinibacter waterburyi]|uniref:arginine--tRNA ligase n=1 Tax=Teredinibacter waterburyi TaxID=1500538 RepID=UPI00165ED01C|nr:arginine--tRNA ligase [Teredinibacter waterburyi]